MLVRSEASSYKAVYNELSNIVHNYPWFSNVIHRVLHSNNTNIPITGRDDTLSLTKNTHVLIEIPYTFLDGIYDTKAPHIYNSDINNHPTGYELIISKAGTLIARSGYMTHYNIYITRKDRICNNDYIKNVLIRDHIIIKPISDIDGHILIYLSVDDPVLSKVSECTVDIQLSSEDVFNIYSSNHSDILKHSEVELRSSVNLHAIAEGEDVPYSRLYTLSSTFYNLLSKYITVPDVLMLIQLHLEFSTWYDLADKVKYNDIPPKISSFNKAGYKRNQNALKYESVPRRRIEVITI